MPWAKQQIELICRLNGERTSLDLLIADTMGCHAGPEARTGSVLKAGEESLEEVPFFFFLLSCALRIGSHLGVNGVRITTDPACAT